MKAGSLLNFSKESSRHCFFIAKIKYFLYFLRKKRRWSINIDLFGRLFVTNPTEIIIQYPLLFLV